MTMQQDEQSIAQSPYLSESIIQPMPAIDSEIHSVSDLLCDAGEGYVDDVGLNSRQHHTIAHDDIDRDNLITVDAVDSDCISQSFDQSSVASRIAPCFPYIILTLAILSISCAGTLLKLLHDTPPLLKAFWRLLFMSVVLSAGFMYQWKKLGNQRIDQSSDLTIKQMFWSRDNMVVLLVSGLACSAHFGFWITSLNHTSLAHSLFFVSTYPVVCVLWMLVRKIRLDRLEVVGVVTSLVGAMLLISDTARAEQENSEPESNASIPPSVFGDFLAFLGAVVFVVYLYAGQRARSWLPLFMYAAPMTLISSLPMLVLSLALEDVTLIGLTPSSVFGFLAPSCLWILVLIAIGPGGFGHTGVNYCVKHLSPLIISVTMTLEPMLGVIVGVLAGVESQPHALTLVGGPISVIGTILAIYGTHQREQREKTSVAVSRSDHETTQPNDEIIAHSFLLGKESDELIHDPQNGRDNEPLCGCTEVELLTIEPKSLDSFEPIAIRKSSTMSIDET